MEPMDRELRQAFQKQFEKYIENHLDLIQSAQKFSKKIIDYGFLETEKSMPFQIIPTEMFDANGDLMCRLNVNLDHPMYGLFVMDFDEEACAIKCPDIFKTDFMILKYDELDLWIDNLNAEMGDMYKLSSAAEQHQNMFCELFINSMLERYQSAIAPLLKEIMDYIDAEPRAFVIGQDKMFALITEAKKDYRRALLMPMNWAVFQSLDDLPDPATEYYISDYFDESATDKLLDKLQDFFRMENYFAAPLYLAQRICTQSGLFVEGYSVTEDIWSAAVRLENGSDILVPVIDAKEFRVSLK